MIKHKEIKLKPGKSKIDGTKDEGKREQKLDTASHGVPAIMRGADNRQVSGHINSSGLKISGKGTNPLKRG